MVLPIYPVGLLPLQHNLDVPRVCLLDNSKSCQIDILTNTRVVVIPMAESVVPVSKAGQDWKSPL